MSAPTRFKTTRELQEIGGATACRVLPVEVAASLPMPIKADNRMNVVFLYYNDTQVKGQRVISPPHHAMVLDAVTGKLLRFWACTPGELGVRTPAGPPPGPELDPAVTAAEFWQKMARLLEMSPAVWEAYAVGNPRPDARTQALIQEYRAIYDRIALRPLVPYYEAVAADFFRWLRQV
jgi:hypothetical protein